jgi:hypothetical protein
MIKLYYSIWVDGLLRLRSMPSNKGSWKALALLFMTIAMGLNVATIMAILQTYILQKTYYTLNVQFFGIEKLDNFLSFFFLFWFGPLLLNYLLVLHKKKYLKLIQIYPYHQGRRFTLYFLSSVWVFTVYGLFFAP